MKNILNKIKKIWGIDEIKIFIITFILHESVVLFLHFYNINVYGFYNDDSDYHEFAIQITNMLKDGNYFFGAVYQFHWYPFFVSIFYFIFGPIKLLVISLNAILISFSSVIFFKIISLINKNKSKILFWFSLFVMNASVCLMYYSSLLLKEAWIIFLVLFFVYICMLLALKENYFWFKFFLFLIIFVLLFYLRFFIAYAVLFGFLIFWISQKSNFTSRYKLFKSVMIFLSSFILIFILNGGYIFHFNFRSDNSLSPFSIIKPDFVDTIRSSYFAGGKLTTDIKVVYENTRGVTKFNLYGIVKSSVNTIIGPLPGQISFKKYLMILPEMLVWYFIFLLGIIGLFKVKIKSYIIFLVPVLIILAGLSMAVDNFGALLRYRLSALVLLSVFSYFGLVWILNNFRK